MRRGRLETTGSDAPSRGRNVTRLDRLESLDRRVQLGLRSRELSPRLNSSDSGGLSGASGPARWTEPRLLGRPPHRERRARRRRKLDQRLVILFVARGSKSGKLGSGRTTTGGSSVIAGDGAASAGSGISCASATSSTPRVQTIHPGPVGLGRQVVGHLQIQIGIGWLRAVRRAARSRSRSSCSGRRSRSPGSCTSGTSSRRLPHRGRRGRRTGAAEEPPLNVCRQSIRLGTKRVRDIDLSSSRASASCGCPLRRRARERGSCACRTRGRSATPRPVPARPAVPSPAARRARSAQRAPLTATSPTTTTHAAIVTSQLPRRRGRVRLLAPRTARSARDSVADSVPRPRRRRAGSNAAGTAARCHCRRPAPPRA